VIEATLGRLAAGEDLSMDDMARAIEAVMLGLCSESEIALLLTGLHLKGETVAEIAGAAAALRRHMTPIRTRREGVIDTCGTGGDASGTFNISTAAALVTAAAGVPVAKHGNRRVTSRSGSADVLAQLGVNIEASVACVEACLDELGICFCFAPLLHGSMKHVAPVRQKLGTPSIFNLLGPLSNPAGAPFQLLGVGRAELRPLMAEALALLGTRRALVVCGEDGLDEVTLAGPTRVSEVSDGQVRDFAWTPADFGLEVSSLFSLQVTGPEESAALIRRVLEGERGAPRDIVVANAAAALWTAGAADTPRAAANAAAAAIDSQAAARLLANLADRTHRDA
jgi:anthranilate phosphoribosyltransferase